MKKVHKVNFKNYLVFMCGEKNGFGADDWKDVNCEKCLEQKPKEQGELF